MILNAQLTKLQMKQNISLAVGLPVHCTRLIYAKRTQKAYFSLPNPFLLQALFNAIRPLDLIFLTFWQSQAL